jgi:predicted CoA-binding protein
LLKTPFAIGAKVVWMQSGAENEEVAAQAAGLQAVVGACMMTAHRIVVRKPATESRRRPRSLLRCVRKGNP